MLFDGYHIIELNTDNATCIHPYMQYIHAFIHAYRYAYIHIILYLLCVYACIKTVLIGMEVESPEP